MTKLVSVTVTTHNRAHLLPSCLASIRAQTYSPLEIVIVDDASTDDTASVVAAEQAADTRIRYIRHTTNKGNAASRNTALYAARGAYLAWMDDDDEWIDPEKLTKQVAILQAYGGTPTVTVCSSVRLYEEHETYRDKIVVRPKNLRAWILARNGVIYSPTVMTHRWHMLEVGGFDEKMPRGVDSEFHRHSVVRLGCDVYFMPDVTTAIYEYGPDRITPKQDADKFKLSFWTHLYLLRKYAGGYIRHPSAFAQRAKSAAREGILYAWMRLSRS